MGSLNPEKLGDETGYYIPEVFLKTTEQFRYLQLHPENKVSPNLIYSSLLTPPTNKENIFILHSKLPIPIGYPPLPYLVSALVMGLISFVSTPSVLLLVYVGRLVNLIVWLA